MGMPAMKYFLQVNGVVQRYGPRQELINHARRIKRALKTLEELLNGGPVPHIAVYEVPGDDSYPYPHAHQIWGS